MSTFYDIQIAVISFNSH